MNYSKERQNAASVARNATTAKSGKALLQRRAMQLRQRAAKRCFSGAQCNYIKKHAAPNCRMAFGNGMFHFV
jgi:hypothetical protein